MELPQSDDDYSNCATNYPATSMHPFPYIPTTAVSCRLPPRPLTTTELPHRHQFPFESSTTWTSLDPVDIPLLPRRLALSTIPTDTRTYTSTISEHGRKSKSFFFWFFFSSTQDRHTAMPNSLLWPTFTNPRPFWTPRLLSHHAEHLQRLRAPLPMPTPHLRAIYAWPDPPWTPSTSPPTSTARPTSHSILPTTSLAFDTSIHPSPTPSAKNQTGLMYFESLKGLCCLSDKSG